MLKTFLLGATIVASSLFLAACGDSSKEIVSADGTQYKEGIHYSILSEPIASMESNEVLELFWYGCPHCYSAEEKIKPWEAANKDKYVLNQQHSQISNSWMFDAYVFYGLKGLGKFEQLHSQFFDARHNGKINNEKDFSTWLMSNQISKEDFDKASVSPDIIKLRTKNSEIEKKVKSNGVPLFIVSGKYKVEISGLSSLGGWTALPSLLEYLLEKDLTVKQPSSEITL